MGKKWRKVVAVFFACMVAGAFSAPAVATNYHPNPKCNSGNGNGSEPAPGEDCDPGNSGGNNNGGD